MGVMKLIHTERTIVSKSLIRFSADERLALRSLISADDARRAAILTDAAPKPDAGGKPGDDYYFRFHATGPKPTLIGHYLVVDTLSETTQFVDVIIIDGNWLVRRSIALATFNQASYRWFRIADLTSDDCRLASRS